MTAFDGGLEMVATEATPPKEDKAQASIARASSHYQQPSDYGSPSGIMVVQTNTYLRQKTCRIYNILITKNKNGGR